MSPLRVLLTGPSGRVGRYLLPALEPHYDLSTFDMVASERPQSYLGTLQDEKSLREAMRGVDVVVHMAATSDEAPFLEELMPNNIEGMYKLMEAAHVEGVRRVVFFSSVQTLWEEIGQADGPIETDVLAPLSLYGVTKIFGEVLGQWYHRHRGMEFVAIRLGWFQPTEALDPDSWINNVWISPGDTFRLVQRAIETPDVGFLIVNGSSKTLKEVMSLKSAREVLGYEPQDEPPQASSS